MLPVVQAFMAAHQLLDVTVVANAGMVSEANQKQIEAAGLSFVLGQRIPDVPYVVAHWHRDHLGEEIPDGHVFTQPWPGGPDRGRRDQVIYYQYRHDRARRTLGGIDEQVARPRKPLPGRFPSSATGSSSSPAIPTPSPPNWRPKPERWPTSVRPSTASTVTQMRTNLS